jgi:hypothetical protein
VSDSSSAARPRWVHKSDGRLVPFDADTICRDLFAATESLGQPDTFLARELTDSVLHFLSVETEANTPTTAQIVEVAVKVVRELGYPKLAHAFSQQSARRTVAAERPQISAALPLGPTVDEIRQLLSGGAAAPSALAWSLSRRCLRDYSLRAVYSRDIVAAQTGGLIILGGLDTPLELAGYALGLNEAEVTSGSLAERLLAVRSVAGDFVALDGPEYRLESTSAADFARQLRLGLEASGLGAIVNLNCAQPPASLARPKDGPLFAGSPAPPAAEQRAEIAESLLDCLLTPRSANGGSPVRIDWHLASADFQDAPKKRLLQAARRAAEGAALTFVFDRPRRLVSLAESLDRQHPAMLMAIGLNLPRLAEQPGVQGQAERFLDKLGSLVRMALSAATQRRDFLRRHSEARPDLTSGFLLDRARLVLTPVGLEAVVQRFTGRGLCDDGAGAALGRQIVEHLVEAVRVESRHRYLESSLDSAGPPSFDEQSLVPSGLSCLSPEKAPGITCWDPQMPLRHQLQGAGQLQAVTKTGTALLLLSAGQSITAEQVVDLLHRAWQETEITRLRLRRLPCAQPSHTPLWRE